MIVDRVEGKQRMRMNQIIHIFMYLSTSLQKMEDGEQAETEYVLDEDGNR